MYEYALPSGQTVELRELTGTEEALLTNQRLMRTGAAINQVLRNCTVRIGDQQDLSEKDFLDLPSGDRLFILVRLREITFGPECSLEVACQNPQCGQVNYCAINTEELNVTPYGDDREFLYELPRSKRVINWVIMDGHMESRLAKLEEPTIHTAMLMRIKEVDGTAPSKNTLLGLSAADLAAFRAEIARREGGIDTEVRSVCRACGTPIVTRLEREADFLFPKNMTS